MTKTHSLTSMLVVVYAVVGLAGCDSATAPSSMPQVVEGTLDLQPVTFDVITIQVNRDGTFSSNVNWNDANNDIDSALVRGTCTVDQINAEAEGCRQEDTLALEDSLAKPSVFTAQVTAGTHTVGLFNLGPGADTLSYRFEIN